MHSDQNCSTCIYIFCVACVAWQTHRDDRRLWWWGGGGWWWWSLMSLSHFSFLFNNFWRDLWISFKFWWTLYHYEIQVSFDIGNHPPNFGWVLAHFRLSFCYLFLLNNFWRDALISFKLCRTLYQCKIQVKINIGNHPPNFGWVMALFRLSFCWCVDIGFGSITFGGIHWFY